MSTFSAVSNNTPVSIQAVFCVCCVGFSFVGLHCKLDWMLASPSNLGRVRHWQCVYMGAMLLNLWTVGQSGRLDDEMADQLRKERMQQRKKLRADEEQPLLQSQSDILPEVPKASPPGRPVGMLTRSLFAPAGWAFAIWGPIYAGEIMSCFALNFVVGPITTHAVLATAAPWWARACISQAAWCLTFRPAFRDQGGGLWLFVPALMLGSTAYSLCRWHSIVQQGLKLSIAQPLTLCIYVPITMHFVWALSATLVNVNGAVASTLAQSQRHQTDADAILKYVASLSGVLATGLATLVCIKTRTPTAGFVGSWALGAIASEMNERIEGKKNARYNRQGAELVRGVCLVGSVVCFVSAIGTWLGASPNVRLIPQLVSLS
eukprot:gb/GEZN01009104.1/.p1 GENE.gb/GEZN01009104.1/~~gb/GEZN01009104.1/.p1  ORF type:complete len:384 (+),score=46.93 gb/GEZN01009104.1/:27-1154(+)